MHTVLATATFRRPKAWLAVLLVSTDDDPSLATPAQVTAEHDYLAALVGDPGWELAIGVVAPASAQGLRSLANSFGDVGWFSELASASWPALPYAVEEYAWHEWWPACIEQIPVDADPATDGLQPDCICTETRTSASGRTDGVIPRCPDSGTGSTPCWKVRYDTNRCPKNGLELSVDGWRPECIPSYVARYSLTCAISYEPPAYSPKAASGLSADGHAPSLAFSTPAFVRSHSLP